MSKERLIKVLLQHELNEFCFSVWARYNEAGDLEFALCLKGGKPARYDINLLEIGGNPDIDYNYNYIDFMIDDTLECYHEYL